MPKKVVVKKKPDMVESFVMRESMMVDSQFVHELMIAVSELHGRVCHKIAECKDMAESTRLSKYLENMCLVYNDIEELSAIMDGREPEILDI